VYAIREKQVNIFIELYICFETFTVHYYVSIVRLIKPLLFNQRMRLSSIKTSEFKRKRATLLKTEASFGICVTITEKPMLNFWVSKQNLVYGTLNFALLNWVKSPTILATGMHLVGTTQIFIETPFQPEVDEKQCR